MNKNIFYKLVFIITGLMGCIVSTYLNGFSLSESLCILFIYSIFYSIIFFYVFGYNMHMPTYYKTLVKGQDDLARGFMFFLGIFVCIFLLFLKFFQIN